MEDDDSEEIRLANDHFFQGYFGIEDASRGFLEPNILPELSAALDWEDQPMELIRGLFVDPRLRFKSSDLVWKVRTKADSEALVCISFDHQTRPDKWMALRTLLIQALALHRSLGEDEGKPKAKLPACYCIVLYQGTEPWNAPLDLHELTNFDGFPHEHHEAIIKFAPQARYQLLKLEAAVDEKLPENRLTRLGLTLMRAAMLHTLADWVIENRREFALLLQRDDSDTIFALMFNYAAQKVRGGDELNELNQSIEMLEEPVQEKAMTGAQILEARGAARGKAETLIDAARKMLSRDFEPELIADILEAPFEAVTKLARGEEPDLLEWIDAKSFE